MKKKKLHTATFRAETHWLEKLAEERLRSTNDSFILNNFYRKQKMIFFAEKPCFLIFLSQGDSEPFLKVFGEIS